MKPGNKQAEHVDFVSLISEHIDQFSLGERLRLAAHLLDDAKKPDMPDPVGRIRRARTIIALVDREALKLLKGGH